MNTYECNLHHIKLIIYLISSILFAFSFPEKKLAQKIHGSPIYSKIKNVSPSTCRDLFICNIISKDKNFTPFLAHKLPISSFRPISEFDLSEVIKLGRKDLQPKETEKGEEEDDDEHEVEEEKDDEIDESEQYKFDDEVDTVTESEEKDGESQTVNEAREEHYKADDASSAVTHEHDDQTLDYSKFLEMGISEHENQVPNGASLNTTDTIQETRPESALKVNFSSDHGQHYSDSTQVVEEPETSLKLTNMSAVVEPQTILTTKENNTGSIKTMAETKELDGGQHDAIDATDLIRLEDLDAFGDGEDTVAE